MRVPHAAHAAHTDSHAPADGQKAIHVNIAHSAHPYSGAFNPDGETAMSDRAVIRRHLGALLEEAHAARMSDEVVGRMLLDEIIELWQRTRSVEDIAAELRYLIDNLDPDQEYPFMRP